VERIGLGEFFERQQRDARAPPDILDRAERARCAGDEDAGDD
jgi:hypothetical protein